MGNQQNNVQKAYTEQDARLLLQAKREQGRTLRSIADDYENITYGDIQRALKGQFPKSPRKRAAFNLSALIPAPACPVHGVVHVTKRCPVEKHYTDLFSMPVSMLRKMLVNRKEMK